MTVDQVLEKVGDDPYSIMLVWRSTKRLSSRTLNDVQWAVYDVHTGAGQGGIASHSFLSTHDVLAYVQDMVHNMNAKRHQLHGMADDWSLWLY